MLEALEVVRLRGAGRAADAIAAGTPAQKNDDVARLGLLATHVIGRGRRDDGTDFHALGDIARMIQLVDRACGQADLVAVGRVAGGGRRHELALRKLAFKRFRHGGRGVTRTGYAHRLVHVAAPRKRVADSTPQTRSRAAERLDLGGMVVRLVLEEIEPVLVLPVDVDRTLHRAGVDFLRLVEAGQDALGF